MMVLRGFLICALTLISCSDAVEVTFQDVSLRGYSVFTKKFEVKIESASNLKDALPENAVFDALEVVNASIPVLYENSVADIEELDELILENDGIQHIHPGALKNLPTIRKISLKHNKLTELEYGVFNDLSVGSLDLSHNLLKKIDSRAFDNMAELLNVDLSNNKLTAWDSAWFSNTPLLTRISLQHNLIANLPANAFRNLAGEKHFGKVDLTVNIILSHNQIKNLDPASFTGLKKIRNLWIDNNQIEKIDENLFKGIHIDDLKINDNQISCLDGDLNKILTVSSVNLNGNPWNCTCLEGIKEWYKKSSDIVVEMSYSEMDCATVRIRQKIDSLMNRLDEIKDKEA